MPVLVTGFSGQSLEWIAENGNGWISFPRNPEEQRKIVESFCSLTDEFKPFAQTLYIDLAEDPEEGPIMIYLGISSKLKYLINYLNALEAVGVNHVIFNVKVSKLPIADVIAELREDVIPHFPYLTTN